MSAVDIAYRMVKAAQYMAEHQAEITAARLACETCDTIGKRLGVDGSTIAFACQQWGVKPPHPLRKGREPLVDGPRCTKCGILLSEVPGSDGAVCGYCLAPRGLWREWVCNTDAAAIGAAGIGRMEL